MALEGMAMDTEFRDATRMARPSVYLRVVKPVLDKVLVLVTLPMTLPMIAVIALVVRLTSAGPVFLQLTCLGLDGRTFRQLRFRSVHMDAASRQFRAQTGQPGPAGDVRLTPVGRFLIRSQLNTLPQIFNVLLGHMSLVGPQAEPANSMDTTNSVTRIILRVRPGLFAPDHLPAAAALTPADRQAVALAYAAKAGFGLDLRVLLAALGRFFGRSTN